MGPNSIGLVLSSTSLGSISTNLGRYPTKRRPCSTQFGSSSVILIEGPKPARFGLISTDQTRALFDPLRGVLGTDDWTGRMLPQRIRRALRTLVVRARGRPPPRCPKERRRAGSFYRMSIGGVPERGLRDFWAELCQIGPPSVELVGRLRAAFGRLRAAAVASTSLRSSPTLVEPGLVLADAGPTLTDIVPNEAELAPTRVNIAPDLVDSRPTSVEIEVDRRPT